MSSGALAHENDDVSAAAADALLELMNGANSNLPPSAAHSLEVGAFVTDQIVALGNKLELTAALQNRDEPVSSLL